MPRDSKISSSTTCIEQQRDSRSTDLREDQGLYDNPNSIYTCFERGHPYPQNTNGSIPGNESPIPVRFPLHPSHESHEHRVLVVGPVSHEYFQPRINALPSRSNPP